MKRRTRTALVDVRVAGVPGTAAEVEEDTDDGVDSGKRPSYVFSFYSRGLPLGLLHSAGVFYVLAGDDAGGGRLGVHRLCAQYPCSFLHLTL